MNSITDVSEKLSEIKKLQEQVENVQEEADKVIRGLCARISALAFEVSKCSKKTSTKKKLRGKPTKAEICKKRILEVFNNDFSENQKYMPELDEGVSGFLPKEIAKIITGMGFEASNIDRLISLELRKLCDENFVVRLDNKRHCLVEIDLKTND